MSAEFFGTHHRPAGDLLKLDFFVELSCGSCCSKISEALKERKGVQSFEIKLSEQKVLVESCLPVSEVLSFLESTGLRAVYMGAGDSLADGANFVSVVAQIGHSTSSSLVGIVRLFESRQRDTAPSHLIDLTIDGLVPDHIVNLDICSYGDVTEGPRSCGPILDTISCKIPLRSNSDGRLSHRGKVSLNVELNDVIGRSVVVAVDANRRLACGIIARSAAALENAKKICACDGIVLWDERNVPAAGPLRQSFAASKNT